MHVIVVEGGCVMGVYSADSREVGRPVALLDYDGAEGPISDDMVSIPQLDGGGGMANARLGIFQVERLDKDIARIPPLGNKAATDPLLLRLRRARDIYRRAFKLFESFSGDIGGNLVYLMGAILSGGRYDVWPDDPLAKWFDEQPKNTWLWRDVLTDKRNAVSLGCR